MPSVSLLTLKTLNEQRANCLIESFRPRQGSFMFGPSQCGAGLSPVCILCFPLRPSDVWLLASIYFYFLSFLLWNYWLLSDVQVYEGSVFESSSTLLYPKLYSLFHPAVVHLFLDIVRDDTRPRKYFVMYSWKIEYVCLFVLTVDGMDTYPC